MQTAAAPAQPPPLAGWRAILFAPVGDGQRRRRGSDGARLAFAIFALICCLLIIHYNSRIDRAIIEVIHPPPRSITWLVTVVYEVGSYGVVAALVLVTLIARRWAMARDLGAERGRRGADQLGCSSCCSAARAGGPAGRSWTTTT